MKARTGLKKRLWRAAAPLVSAKSPPQRAEALKPSAAGDMRDRVKAPQTRPAQKPLFCFYTYAKPWWPPLMAARRQLLMDRCTL